MNLPQVFDISAEVLCVEEVKGQMYRATLKAPQIAETARPFQFVNVKVTDRRDPFLRRPFSLSAMDPDAGTVEITWAVVGQGTKIMSNWKPGQLVQVLGPLGNGIVPEDLLNTSSLPDHCKPSSQLILVAGGTGIAPMGPLAKLASTAGWDVVVCYGARDFSCVADLSRFEDAGCQIFVATEDGSAGKKGLVTDLLKYCLKKKAANVAVVACGPRPMLRAAKSICTEKHVKLYVSLEERMACGTGLCKGCAVKASDKKIGYYHVCTDGPVFLADAVDLEE